MNNGNQQLNQQAPSPPPPEVGYVPIKISLPTVKPVVTYILLTILVLIYLYTQSLSLLGRQLFLLDWAKINDAVYAGEYYRLFTSMFLHLNFIHILLNGYALWLFGRDVESLFGYARFTIIYLLGGLAGSVGSLLYTDAASIGASGAVFAIFGALGVYFYQHRHLYGDVAQQRLMQMTALGVINILIGLAPNNNIDNAAHIGGLCGGIVLAWFIAPEFQLKRDLPESSSVRVIDANTFNKWIVVPVLFVGAIILTVVYAASELG